MLQGALLLVATAGGAELSDAAAAAPPLKAVPRGPAPSLLFGNWKCYIDGDLPFGYNCAANVFSKAGIAAWGDTALLHLPKSGGGADTLKVCVLPAHAMFWQRGSP